MDSANATFQLGGATVGTYDGMCLYWGVRGQTGYNWNINASNMTSAKKTWYLQIEPDNTVVISEGKLNIYVYNYGTINGGNFSGCENQSNGIISGGTFSDSVANMSGLISGGPVTANSSKDGYAELIDNPALIFPGWELKIADTEG